MGSRAESTAGRRYDAAVDHPKIDGVLVRINPILLPLDSNFDANVNLTEIQVISIAQYHINRFRLYEFGNDINYFDARDATTQVHTRMAGVYPSSFMLGGLGIYLRP